MYSTKAAFLIILLSFITLCFLQHPSYTTETKSFDSRSYSYTDEDSLKKGLYALNLGDISYARSLYNSMSHNSLDRHILSWAIALYAEKYVPAEEIIKTARSLSRWSGIEKALLYNGERALFRENPTSEKVLSLFQNNKPQTPEGSVLLARAFRASGDIKAARKILVPIWRQEKLIPSLEEIILNEFSEIFTVLDHRIRMENMLYHERINSAQKVSTFAQSEKLFAAWSAVLRKHDTAGALLERVPASQRSTAYLFVKTKYLRKTERFLEAADILLKAPQSENLLINPDAWWIERRALSRDLLDLGKINLAYKIVSENPSKTTLHITDSEFHAGWYALRGLKDPKRASYHFSRLLKSCKGPISRSRGFYWLGRAAEMSEKNSGDHYFSKAARYGTTFYGQLSAARIGNTTLNLSPPSPSSDDHKRFSKRVLVRAIQKLEELGFHDYTDRLYEALAENLETSGEFFLLVSMAKKQKNLFLALQIAKIATRRNFEVGSLTHPTGIISSNVKMSKEQIALAYAIARQESEFRNKTVSSAGARGMLQIMPHTAEEAAKKIGVEYSHTRLTHDVSYNASLAVHIFEKKLKRFNGSYILAFGAYNAGPRRVRNWVEHYGDPRGKKIDFIIDWIERIPFSETRSYIQRIMESYQVYKMRFTDHFDIIHDLKKTDAVPVNTP